MEVLERSGLYEVPNKINSIPYVQIQSQLRSINNTKENAQEPGTINQDIISIINEVNRIPAGFLLMKQCNQQDQADYLVENIPNLQQTHMSLSKLHQQTSRTIGASQNKNQYSNDPEDIQIDALKTDQVAIEDELSYWIRFHEATKGPISKADEEFYSNKVNEIMSQYGIQQDYRTDQSAINKMNVSKFRIDSSHKNEDVNINQLQKTQHQSSTMHAQNTHLNQNINQIKHSDQDKQLNNSYQSYHHESVQQANIQTFNKSDEIAQRLQIIERRENELFLREKALHQSELKLQQDIKAFESYKQNAEQAMLAMQNQNRYSQQRQVESIQKTQNYSQDHADNYVQIYDKTNQSESKNYLRGTKKSVDLDLVPQVFKQKNNQQNEDVIVTKSRNNINTLSQISTKQQNNSYENNVVTQKNHIHTTGKAQLGLSSYDMDGSKSEEELHILTKSQIQQFKFYTSGSELRIRSQEIGSFTTPLHSKYFQYKNGCIEIRCTKEIEIINKKGEHQRQFKKFKLEINDQHGHMWSIIRSLLKSD